MCQGKLVSVAPYHTSLDVNYPAHMAEANCIWKATSCFDVQKWRRGSDCSGCTCYSPVLSPNGRPILKADSIHLRKNTVTIELREQVLAQSCIKWLKLFLLSFQIAFCKWPYSSVWFYFKGKTSYLPAVLAGKQVDDLTSNGKLTFHSFTFLQCHSLNKRLSSPTQSHP